ncbi:MAG: DUF5686 family protein [Bacteroidota bacterium]
MKNTTTIKTIVLPFLCLFLPTFTFCQQTISGIVTDEANDPLPFVNILINENQTDGVSTDIDGQFFIESDEPIEILTLTFVGYEKLVYPVRQEDFSKKLQLTLKATSFELTEAVVIAGENPAHRIIRKVVKNRNQNNPERMTAYQCKIYNKLIVELLPNKEKINEWQEKHRDSKKKIKKQQSENFDKFLKNAEKNYVMIMESVSERQFLFPERVKEHVLHNRVSGFKNPNFVALANNFQPFSFYQTHIEILDKAYLNPISTNSTRKYFFDIQDTLYQKADTVFVIAFKPKKNKNFEGLKGLLYINTNGYAIQNVIAEPFDKSFIHLKIEQRYQHTDEKQWFPEQLNFVMEATKYPHKYIGTRLMGKSYINEVVLDPDLKKKQFKNQGYTTAKNANVRTDSLWEKNRPQVLTEKEMKTYEIIDSIGAKKKFDQLMYASEALASGRYPLGKIDVLVPKVLSFNEYENVRLGLGLSTNDRLSPHFELGGYAGYGFADKVWKYGGSLLFNLLKDENLQLKFNYQKDISEPAALKLTAEPQLFSRQLYANRMDTWENKSVALRGRLWESLRFNAFLRQNSFQPNYTYQFNGSDEPFEQFDFTEVGLNLRLAFREKSVRVMGTEIFETRFPIIHLAYTKGIDNWLNSEFDFQQIVVAIQDNFRTRTLGETTLRLEAGQTLGDVPYSKLFAASGIGRGFQWLEISNTFQTMEIYEFLSDRFVHFFFEHNFESLLFKLKNFKPQLSIVQNMGWGKLDRPELHDGFEFQTMEKGFFESGLRIDNLVRLNYFNVMFVGLGGGIYLRYGNYALPTLEENLAYRFRLMFSF